MDYEKKYKEALEKAHQLCAYPTTKPFISDLQDIFPELKESEDEKARKGIIDYVTLYKDSLVEEEYKSWIVWLEKQGEPSIKWNKNTEGNKPQVNHSVLMKTTHGIAEGEWQGENWHQYRWAGIVRDSDVLSWMEFSDLEKQCEQKPAWSEEDERMLHTIIADFKGFIRDNTSTLESHFNECINWLKSLKQKIGSKL